MSGLWESNRLFQLLKHFVSVWHLRCWMFPRRAPRCWLRTCLAGRKPRHGSPVPRLCELSLPSETGGLGRISAWLWWSWASCCANRLPNFTMSTAQNIGVCFALACHFCLRVVYSWMSYIWESPLEICLSSVVFSGENPEIANAARTAVWGRKVCQKLCHGCANICSFFSRVLASALLTYGALEICVIHRTHKFFLCR